MLQYVFIRIHAKKSDLAQGTKGQGIIELIIGGYFIIIKAYSLLKLRFRCLGEARKIRNQ